MLMVFRHAAREALPVKELLNGRSFECLRSLDKGGHDVDCWRHTDPPKATTGSGRKIAPEA
jgi:hypothetical protein